jgi:hypothetical protein
VRPLNDELRSRNLEPIPTEAPLPGAASVDRVGPEALAAIECARDVAQCETGRAASGR